VSPGDKQVSSKDIGGMRKTPEMHWFFPISVPVFKIWGIPFPLI
jgi:hypothetical protein